MSFDITGSCVTLPNMETPSWLATHDNMEQQHDLSPQYTSTVRDIALRDAIYEPLFERILENIANGISLETTIQDDPRNLSLADFKLWMASSTSTTTPRDRRRMLREAKAEGADTLLDEVLPIADGTDNPMEDVERSKLRIKARFDLAAAWAPNRYGKSITGASSGGGGPITINIGQVESPYANPRPIEIDGNTINV